VKDIEEFHPLEVCGLEFSDPFKTASCIVRFRHDHRDVTTHLGKCGSGLKDFSAFRRATSISRLSSASSTRSRRSYLLASKGETVRSRRVSVYRQANHGRLDKRRYHLAAPPVIHAANAKLFQEFFQYSL